MANKRTNIYLVSGICAYLCLFVSNVIAAALVSHLYCFFLSGYLEAKLVPQAFFFYHQIIILKTKRKRKYLMEIQIGTRIQNIL